MAANVLDVVAKAWTVATNFLRFCRADNDGVAFMVGTLGFECAVGVGCAVRRIYSSSGLPLGWTVTLGSKSMGIG